MPFSRRLMLASGLVILASPGISRANSAPVRRRYVDGPFGQIHLRFARPADPARESQPPLACFHYSPGSSRMYQFLLPLLATDRLVMAFDTPGYGLSEAPTEQPAIADYAKALATAVKSLTDAPQIDVLGHLTGSFIAIEMAVAEPDFVRRVVLSRSPVFSEEMRTRGVTMFKDMHAQQQADPSGQYYMDSLKMGLDQLKPGDPLEYAMGVYTDSLLAGNNWVFGEVAAFSFRADVQMPKMTQPVLYITWTREFMGTGEPFGGDETWEGGLQIIPNVSTVDIAGLGDWVWQDHPNVLAGHVLSFLNGN